jgi:ferredoxin
VPVTEVPDMEVPVIEVPGAERELTDRELARPEVRFAERRLQGKALQVDAILCAGHGVCAELLPEWVRLDEWGYPVVRAEQVPDHLLAGAKWAVANCPALALHLRQPTPTGRPVRS